MPELRAYLSAAAADPDFKRDMLAYLGGSATSRIQLDGHAPRVKVERVLTKLLRAEPTLEVERVQLRARSGCSDFTGELVVKAGDVERRFAFTWCCAWRAEQQGWRDCFGFWDQARAAREFGWDCFQRWEPLDS